MYKTTAFLYSLQNAEGEQKRGEVIIVSQTDNNNITAVYGNKLCTAIYNVFVGAVYVDDVYGVIREISEAERKEYENEVK